MTNDIMEQLRQLRPDAEDLDRRWPVEARNRLAETISRDEPGTPARLRHLPRRSRLIVGSTLVAAAVAAAIAVPTLLPDGAAGAASPAAASALHRLARVSADSAADTATRNQFVHTIIRQHQSGVFSDDGTREDFVTTSEIWTAADGRFWRRDTEVDTGGGSPSTSTSYFPVSMGEAAYLASLPTGASNLEHYLREHASGSNSTDEAVFVAVGDMLRGDTASAAVRSAAVSVLARTNGVTLGRATSDSLGRAVQEFDYIDESGRPGVVEALFFDPHTAQLVDESTTGPDQSSETSLRQSDVVDSVPADVQRTAVRQH